MPENILDCGDNSCIFAEVERLTNALRSALADSARLTMEVGRLEREMDALVNDQRLDDQDTRYEVVEAGEVERLRAEVERLRALLRDECMGHADGCGCRACKEVFRAALGEG